jgi:esterase/lipase superfamily enzyme
VRYDKMICHEIVEKVKNNTQSGKVAIAGCSFGGYHAANFAQTSRLCKSSIFYEWRFNIKNFSTVFTTMMCFITVRLFIWIRRS